MILTRNGSDARCVLISETELAALEQALEILSKTKTPVDLVITDLVMPQMSGRELIEQIRVLSPGLPIISTSGYVRASGKENPATFLPKPFTSQELLRRVKQVLTASESS